ncbi:MAG: radical SAM protein [Prevotellaceae bacterium]|jgi:MoaA/NifB/PqqE/SkfB family radical SAM enzyme|nr:radical SAM protein [Prevotellaceae bacterium]
MKLTEIEKQIALFGLTKGRYSIANKVIDIFESIGQKSKILCILDNNSALHGKKVKGIEVCSPEKIINFNEDNTLVIITTYSFHDEITESVRELGWQGELLIANDMFGVEIEYKAALLNGQIVEITKEGGSINYSPVVFQLELAGRCNIRCLYCPYHGPNALERWYPSGALLSWEILKKITHQAKMIKTLKRISVVGDGEPMMNPEWYEMVAYLVTETGVSQFTIYTNGMLLNEKNIVKLAKLQEQCKITIEISIDGGSPTESEYFRKGSKYSVIKLGIARLKELSPDTNVLIANSSVLPEEFLFENETLPMNLKNPEYLLGDFPGVAVASSYVHPTASIWPPDNKTYYKKLPKQWVPFNCNTPFSWVFLDALGNILDCGCGFHNRESLGNVNTDNILDVWQNSSRLTATRKSMLDGEEGIMCQGCPVTAAKDCFVLFKKSNEEGVYE